MFLIKKKACIGFITVFEKIVLGVNDLEKALLWHKSACNKCPRRLPSGVLRFLKIGHIVATLI